MKTEKLYGGLPDHNRKITFFRKLFLILYLMDRPENYKSPYESSFLKRLNVYPAIPSIMAIMKEKIETLNSNLEVGSSIT